MSAASPGGWIGTSTLNKAKKKKGPGAWAWEALSKRPARPTSKIMESRITASSGKEGVVHMACRVRPPAATDGVRICVDFVNGPDGRKIRCKDPKGTVPPQEYAYNTLYMMGSDQNDIFTGEGARMVQGAIEGTSSSLFIYGLEGSGRDHTLFGSDEDPGLLPRILEGLLSNPRRSTYSVGVSLAAVGHLSIYDLFSVDINNPCREHQMMNNKAMVSLSEMAAKNVASVMAIVRAKVLEYSMNHNCRSTSHLVASLVVREAESEARIHLVRLTNMPESGPGKEHYREGLKRCWTALASDDCEVPYGCSTLTNYLGPSLEFASIMTCVAPAMKHYSSTSHSLVYTSDLGKPYPNFVPRSAAHVSSTSSGMKRPRTPSAGGSAGKRRGLPPKSHNGSSCSSNVSTPMSSAVNTPCTPMTPADGSHMEVPRHMSTPPPSTPTNQDRQATHQVASVSASRNKTATPAHAPPRKASPTPAQAEDVPLLQLSEHQHCGHEVILPSASSAADLLSHLSDGLQHSDDLDFGNENNVVTEEQHQHQHQQLESPQQWQQWQQETSQQQAAEADSHQGQSLPESAKCGDLSGHPKEYLGQEIPLPSASAAAALLSMSYTATAPQSKRQKTRVSKPRSPLVDGADLDATRPRASTAPKSKVAAVAAAAASTAGKATTTTTTTTAVAAAAAPSPPVSTLEAPAAMQLPTANEVAATRGTQEHAGSEFLSIEAELGVDQESNDADQGMYHHQQQQQHHHLQQHQQSSSIEQDLGIDHQHMSIEEQIVVDQRSSIEQNLSIDGESLIEADLVMDDSIEAELGLDQGTCIDAEDVLLLRPDDNCEVDHAAALSHDASLWDEVVRADSNSQPNSTSYEAPQACYSSPLPSRRSEEREKALFSSPFVMFASPPVLAKPKTSSANPRAADSPGMSPFAMSMQGGNQLDEVAAEWNLQ